MAFFLYSGHGSSFWERAGELPVPVYGAKAVVRDTLIYIIGGYSDSQDAALDTIQIYNPADNSWLETPYSLFTPRYGLNAHIYIDSLYVFGGVFDGSFLTLGLEKWDFTSYPIIYSYNYNFNRIYAASVVYKDHLYIFGGYPDYDLLSNDSPLQYLVKYNLPTANVEDSLSVNRWYSDYLPSQQMPALVADNIYLFGGEYNGIRDDIVCYDIGADSLRTVSKLYQERSYGAAVVLDSQQILIIAGVDGENRTLRETEVYNVYENRNDEGPSLLKARSEITAVLYQDTVYVFGGKDSEGKAVPSIEKITLLQIYEHLHAPTFVKSREANRSAVNLSLSNSPNPFNSTTSIRFNLAGPAQVKLSIYSVIGQKIKVLENNRLNAGSHSYTWNGTDGLQNLVPSGLYFCQLTAGSQSITHKLILLK
jgi:hypothetical protein